MKYLWSMLILACVSLQAEALSFEDLWYTPDQQAQLLMNTNQVHKAKKRFKNPEWSATAYYRAGDYQEAAQSFGQLQTERGFYNQANALAHLGKYEQAIAAYKKALAINSQDEDALYNKKLVESLLKKDKDKEKNQDKSGQGQDKKKQQNKNQKSKDQQNKEQQNKDQQNKDKQNKNQEQKPQPKKEKQAKAGAEHNPPSQAEKEKQQAKQQWLQLIPEDPGGLMREKFLRDHLRRERGWYQ